MFGRFQQPEAVLRALIESPQHMVIFALDTEYRYLAYNQNHARTMKQIWGVEIAVGKSMLELIGRDDDRTKARENFDRALSGESFTLIEEYGDARMDRRFYEDVYSPVRNDTGQIIGLAVYLTDITEHRRAQLELESYRNRLEELVAQRTSELEVAHLQLLHAQKLESLGVLAGGIAHDFNNLLAVVLARAELCARELGDDTSLQTHLAIVRETALEARMLTKQLLGYAGKGKFSVEVLDLNDVVRGTSQLLRASVSKDIRLEYVFEQQPLAVQGDATQLRQVILNLVTNAAEAIGSSVGLIRLRTGIEEVTTTALLEASVPGDLSGGSYAFLEVEDSGPGISEEARSKLFDPFFTTKFAGRGLGLAAVLGIVKGHHGAILLDTHPAQGTRFRILLPPADAALIRESPAQESRVVPSLANATALVVDDEGAVRAATSDMLRSVGYSVIEADGGLAAVQLFREHQYSIQVVLLDLAMPDMNGEQTLRELRKIRQDVPVILLTAYAEDEFRMRFVQGDLAGVVAKPFSREELIEALRQVAAKTATMPRQGAVGGSDRPV
ncbi:MAG: hybrid sensor histidine kinase/response regulator [Myxococcota bacterium]